MNKNSSNKYKFISIEKNHLQNLTNLIKTDLNLIRIRNFVNLSFANND